MDPNSATIPEIFIGRYAEAKKSVRSLIRKARKHQDLAAVLRDVNFIPIEECPWHFLFNPPNKGFDFDVVMPFLFTQEMEKTSTADAELDFAETRKIIQPCATQFWLALSVVCGNQFAIAPGRGIRNDPVRNADIKVIIGSILRWWPQLTDLTERYIMGSMLRVDWPMWGGSIWTLFSDMGREDLVKPFADAHVDDAPDILLDALAG
jgi:hypothetical protein